ncbi:MAG: M20/M25/M40 family metallo-hydrolase [Fimbriimonadaceae bacterium]|nr:M20/M25/M40 family metallo-hydrolase [Fimbriimonadaceae bacterium]
MARFIALAMASLTLGLSGQASDIDRIRMEGLRQPHAQSLLRELTKGVGPRLSGSPGAAKAVDWGVARMKALGFVNVHLVPCKVPHWVRGKAESVSMSIGDRKVPLSACALGGSVATPRRGITSEVVEVQSLEEAAALGSRAKGKIIFYNRPFDPTLVNTFSAYGGAVDQRSQGAVAAAKVGAVAVLVRSMTLSQDDAPHTGAMNYQDGVKKIPAAALSAKAANMLSASLKSRPVVVQMKLNCQTLPDADSASVAGEIRGTTFPDEIIVMGGHLDSWDLGEGAHDDGAGIVQSMEALSILKRLNMAPKRTIRVVLFMNEENGLRGGRSYADLKKAEKHIAAIESDAGGFAPRSFGVTGSESQLAKVQSWLPDLKTVGIERVDKGGGGADIGPLGARGTVLIGLVPEGQRYFDVHHSRNDVFEAVHPRELQLGAIAMAMLAWRLSEEGI